MVHVVTVPIVTLFVLARQWRSSADYYVKLIVVCQF